MTRLSVSLLGTFQLTLEGAPITTVESDKVRALLVYLAVEAGRPHRREALAALLWPEAPQQRARQNLRRALHNLRQALQDPQTETPFLLVSRQDIQFNPASDYWLDVVVFLDALAACEKHEHERLESCDPCLQRLEAAVALYRGSFLEGFSVSGSPAFEEWTVLHRERLHRLTQETLHRLAGCYEEKGQYEQALPHAWRQVELDPWRERAHRHGRLAVAGLMVCAFCSFQSSLHRRGVGGGCFFANLQSAICNLKSRVLVR